MEGKNKKVTMDDIFVFHDVLKSLIKVNSWNIR